MPAWIIGVALWLTAAGLAAAGLTRWWRIQHALDQRDGLLPH